MLHPMHSLINILLRDLAGPIKMSIYARIELNNGAEMGVTLDFQEASDLFNGIWKECADGGRAGLGKGFIEAKLCVGGTADIWIAKGSLGAGALRGCRKRALSRTKEPY